MKTIKREFILPGYWALYLGNRDASSLSACERAKVDAFIAKNNLGGATGVLVGDQPGFTRHDGDNGPACNTLEYHFLLNV